MANRYNDEYNDYGNPTGRYVFPDPAPARTTGRLGSFRPVTEKVKAVDPELAEEIEMSALNRYQIDPNTAEALERRADAMLKRAAEMRAKTERFGIDDFPDGSVIIFDKVFHEYGGRPISPSKPYHYAAMKFGGVWNTTGPKSPKAYTWEELINWMGEGVQEIYYVNEITRFV